MALRDKQISGIPLSERQSEFLSHAATALVPVLGYTLWYPMLGIPRELWPVLAVVGVAIHFAQSVEIVENNTERPLLWMGSYTGSSFANGIRWVPKLPSPGILVLVRFLGERVYKKFLWSLGEAIPVRSIPVPFVAEGMTLDGLRVQIKGTLRVEVANAATFASQAVEGESRLVSLIAAEYANGVKASVISQHKAADLMRGYHSGNSSALTEWMTNAWGLIHVFGVELASAPIVEVKILNSQVEHAFDMANAQETFVASAATVGLTLAELKRQHPNLSEAELAILFPSIAGSSSGADVNVHNIKFK